MTVKFGNSALPERFWDKVRIAESGCWEWQAYLRPKGYGEFWLGRFWLAHRVAYDRLVAPIPAGLHIDHLCRNSRCVRPDHLEVVTPQENQRRGIGGPINRGGTCRNGLHPWPESAVQYVDKVLCGPCRRATAMAYVRRQIAQTELKKAHLHGRAA